MLGAFPKAVVDVHALVLESGGSDLAVAACAASLALADAGIEMLDLVSACRVVRPPAHACSALPKEASVWPASCLEICCSGGDLACIAPALLRMLVPGILWLLAARCFFRIISWVRMARVKQPPPLRMQSVQWGVIERACVQSRVDGHLLLDPTADEADREDASALLAMMPSSNEVPCCIGCLRACILITVPCWQPLASSQWRRPQGSVCFLCIGIPAVPPSCLSRWRVTSDTCRVGRAAGPLQLWSNHDRDDAAGKVTDVALAGEWAPGHATEALQLCMGGCAQLDAYMRQTLREAAAAALEAGDVGR